VFSPFLEMSPDEFRRVTEVTYLGAVHGTYAALRRMVARDRGVIVQVGSALAYRGIHSSRPTAGRSTPSRGSRSPSDASFSIERSRVRITMVQLPALNTPHFDVALNRLPREPQPVAPIYEPEVAARAVVWASEHPRRELWVGGSTAATLIANTLVPGLLDRYLGRTGYRSQQSDESTRPGHPTNLWKPVPGDRGAHGRFGEHSHARSIQFWLASHAALAAERAGAAFEKTRRRSFMALDMRETRLSNPAYQGFMLLRTTFVVAPILFGVDKYFNFMVDWPKYLAPWIDDIVPGTAQQFMYVVGAVEILAGILVLAFPRWGSLGRCGLACRHHRQSTDRKPAAVLRHRPP
jgi:NAD(P)-dependent dehydrogenase (short-subunit alcohol dehydrogenase family)